MSSHKRPWYKWYPKDFNQDEKVRCLPPLAEVVYRRALDLMWQSNDIRIPSAMRLLYESLGKGITEDDFAIAWERIQYPDFELFKVSKDEKWLYSARLRKENDEIIEMSNMRSAAGIQGAKARWNEGKKKVKKRLKQTHNKRITNAKQTDSDTDTDTDTDIKEKEYKEKEIYDFYKREINPLKKSSVRAKENIRFYLKKYSKDDLIESINNYKTVCGDDPEYKKDPANFFEKKEKYFIDYLPENFEPPKKDTDKPVFNKDGWDVSYDPFEGCSN